MKFKEPSRVTMIVAITLFLLTILVICVKGEEAQALNLKLDWKGPAGWQTNGAVFNIRIYSITSWLSDYNTWPIIRTVTNTVTTTLTNVPPTQLYAITLRCSNGDTSSFVGPVTAQYLLQ